MAQSGYNSKISHHAGSERKARHRLTDMQILQQIDTAEDPLGHDAMRKIDFRSKNISMGRKEFTSKGEALQALEQSKSRVTEIMQKARDMHLNKFKSSVGKTIKEDHLVSVMPRIRISAAKSQYRNSTFIGNTKRNILPKDGES